MRLTVVRLANRTLPQMLTAARQAGYFNAQYDRSGRVLRLSGTDGSDGGLEELRLGAMLMRNVQHRWRNTTNAGIVRLNELALSEPKASVLSLARGDLELRFKKIRQCKSIDTMPFEMYEEYTTKSPSKRSDSIPATADSDLITIRSSHRTHLSRMLFTSESQAECFMNIQRQRKIWWMRSAANPGRMFASEMRQTNNVHHASLYARFSFGNVEIEKIECISKLKLNGSPYPTVIRSTVDLQSAAMAIVLDALEMAAEHEMCIDRTIAPIQCGILCSTTNVASKADLTDLSRFVELLLKQSDISTYVDPTDGIENRNERLEHFDRIGVPYAILLDDNCLANGFLQLRNRDTTLSETIHLTDVPGYLVDIFRSHDDT